MSKRLIVVPQLPVKMRYTEWWYRELPNNLKPYFDRVIVLGNPYEYEIKGLTTKSDFSLKEAAIKFEADQIKDFINAYEEGDYILLCDISFPGLFSNILFHYRPQRAFAICHASAANYLDYYWPDSAEKFSIESAQACMFKKIFIATYYHKFKLGWLNTKVIGLPKPELETFPSSDKKRDIISVARNIPQKRDARVEKEIERTYGTISEPNASSWKDYYKFISESKVMLITSSEETFGYQVMDAVSNGCIPIAPRAFSYPELLDDKYLYSGIFELRIKIDNALSGKLEPPKELLCQPMVDNFYNALSKEILE